MSKSLDDTMSGSKWSTRPGGFHDKRFSDTEDGPQWKVKKAFKPKTSFKMKKPGQQKGIMNKGRDMNFAIKEMLYSNLKMSTDSNSNSREVRLINQRDKTNQRRWDGRTLNHTALKNGPINNTGERYPVVNPSHGYRITIPFGFKFDKDFVLNSLSNLLAPATFVPIMYKVTHRWAVFYVDDQKIAEKLEACDRKISAPDGFKIRVIVAAGFPRYELDQEMKDRMKIAIAKKYLPDRKALDLSRFHLNPDLVDDYYCSLTREPILASVLRIITQSVPDLVEISLDNNQLHNLEKLKMLTSCSNLKILGICNNRIKNVNQLKAIKDFKLEELRLAGNPIHQTFKGSQDDLVSSIRQLFPDLSRLDGVVLRPSIGFDLQTDSVELPTGQRIFAPNDQARDIATQFLQEYFRVFDSDDRQPLLNAYDEQAIFSMTVSLIHVDNRQASYLSESRNLCKIPDDQRRRKFLKQGRLPIVAYITEIPKTQHDLNSFTMDISLVTESMMLVTMTGIFKELTGDHANRYFSRTVTIVPKGSGYCITNEMLQITRLTRGQEAHQISEMTGTTTTTTTTSTTTDTPSVDIRAQMTAALRERTKMTLEWTLKCLNEVQWNFDTALAAFQECLTRGAIPPEAFEK